MQVNPEWNIPFNIIKTDVAHHGGDSAYFARNKYDIVARDGNDTLRAAKVTKDQLLSGKLKVVQKGAPATRWDASSSDSPTISPSICMTPTTVVLSNVNAVRSHMVVYECRNPSTSLASSCLRPTNGP